MMSYWLAGADVGVGGLGVVGVHLEVGVLGDFRDGAGVEHVHECFIVVGLDGYDVEAGGGVVVDVVVVHLS